VAGYLLNPSVTRTEGSGSVDLRRVLKSIADADPDFDIELTGFMEDEIRKADG